MPTTCSVCLCVRACASARARCFPGDLVQSMHLDVTGPLCGPVVDALLWMLMVEVQPQRSQLIPRIRCKNYSKYVPYAVYYTKKEEREANVNATRYNANIRL